MLHGTTTGLGGHFIAFRNKTGWQLYSVADVLLVAAAIDRWQLRAAVILPTAAALIFAVHAAIDRAALGHSAALGPLQALGAPPFRSNAGLGETAAIVALVIALTGLALGTRGRLWLRAT